MSDHPPARAGERSVRQGTPLHGHTTRHHPGGDELVGWCSSTPIRGERLA
jgi:hypothetical protein